MPFLRYRKYYLRDTKEVEWRYSWEVIGDRIGWFMWRKMPGEDKFFCVGQVSEDEMEKKFDGKPPRFQRDDIIELGLYLKHSFDKEYRPKEGETNEKATSDSGVTSPPD